MLKVLKRKIDQLQNEQDRLKKQIDDRFRRKKVICNGSMVWSEHLDRLPYYEVKSRRGCGRKFSIGRLTYIQTHYYVEPYSCTGGDYWVPGEGNWICPDCGVRNRLYDKPEIQDLKHLFKNIKNEHER